MFHPLASQMRSSPWASRLKSSRAMFGRFGPGPIICYVEATGAELGSGDFSSDVHSRDWLVLYYTDGVYETSRGPGWIEVFGDGTWLTHNLVDYYYVGYDRTGPVAMAAILGWFQSKFRMWGKTSGTLCTYLEFDAGPDEGTTIEELWSVAPDGYEYIELAAGQYLDVFPPAAGTIEHPGVPFNYYNIGATGYFPGKSPSDFPWFNPDLSTDQMKISTDQRPL